MKIPGAMSTLVGTLVLYTIMCTCLYVFVKLHYFLLKFLIDAETNHSHDSACLLLVQF